MLEVVFVGASIVPRPTTTRGVGAARMTQGESGQVWRGRVRSSLGDVVGMFCTRQCSKKSTPEKDNGRSSKQGSACVGIDPDGEIVTCP